MFKLSALQFSVAALNVFRNILLRILISSDNIFGLEYINRGAGTFKMNDFLPGLFCLADVIPFIPNR